MSKEAPKRLERGSKEARKRLIVQGIIAEKGLDVKLPRGNVIPSLNGSI